MQHNWYKGHLGRFWNDDYKKLEYVRQPITEQETAQWISEGYDYVKSFTGKMYDSRNPMPAWVENLPNIFGNYVNLTCTFYKMSTLEIMPTHIDHYRTYQKLFNTDPRDIVRILLMLEDWKPGHYLEIGGVGITNWIAGDYFVWENDCPHAASNIGIEDRYTLQITATKLDAQYVWKNLHWYNIPDLKTKEISSSSPLMLDILNATEKPEGPTFIYMFNEKIKELEDITHDEETRLKLNQQGVHIYLYEPLCSYMKWATQLYAPYGTKHSMHFYSEFLGPMSGYDLRADEFDSVLEYKIRNNLTNITVHTCDYQAEKYYPFYTSQFKIVTDDLFNKTYPLPKIIDAGPSVDFTKKFMCLNWRYTPHRHFIAMYVSRLPSYLSWYYKSDMYNVATTPWIVLLNEKFKTEHETVYLNLLKGLEILNRDVPMNIDLNIKEAITINHPYFREGTQTIYDGSTLTNAYREDEGNLILEQAYKDVFCDIVTESRFAQPTGNYSEKTYQSMLYMKPFILAAPPFTLKYLRELGFKTFSDFWDESYDEEQIHETRLIKIFKLIDFINDKSIDELREMYTKMIPILEHNFNHIQVARKNG